MKASSDVRITFTQDSVRKLVGSRQKAVSRGRGFSLPQLCPTLRCVLGIGLGAAICRSVSCHDLLESGDRSPRRLENEVCT